MSVVSSKSVAAYEEAPVGRQDSHNDPTYDGVSGQAPRPPGSDPNPGRAGVPQRPPATYGAPRAPQPGAVYGTPTGANPTDPPRPAPRTEPPQTGPATPPDEPVTAQLGPVPPDEPVTAQFGPLTPQDQQVTAQFGSAAPQPGPPAVPHPAPAQPAVAQAAGRSRGRRTTLLVGVVCALVLAMVAAAVLMTRPGPVRGWLADAPAPTPTATPEAPEPPPPAVLAAAGADGAAPTAAGVRAALTKLIGDKALGSRVNISVVDVAAGETLYAANPDVRTTPASTTKLVTAATVLAARGPAYRLSTRVVAGAKPGEVVIVGGGDPTLGTTSNRLFPGAARLDRLAAQVKKALGGVRPTRVVVDGSLFTGPTLGPGWDDDLIDPGGQAARITALAVNGGRLQPVHHLVGPDPRFSDPAGGAGQAFAKALGVPGVPVVAGRAPAVAEAASGGPSQAVADAPSPGTQLGVVESPPMVRLVDWMLQLSDNVLAEALARQVALAAGEPASFAGAARAMRATLVELGLPAAEAELYDGSGLSRRNRMTPSFLTELLVLAAGGTRPEMTVMFGGLPVAAWSGTLQQRFGARDGGRTGQGLVRAKTGTLSGVSALSGQVVTADGRLLVFAIMADGVAANARDTARVALDRIATALARCGCP